MATLNQRKIRWIVKHWERGELSHWQIAKQQGITKRHALRVFNRYKGVKQPLLFKPGRPRQPLPEAEVRLVKRLYKQQPMGATNMERILSVEGKHIPHNRLHRILKEHGLVCTQPNKSKRRKWIRYERKHSNSLWHIDYSGLNRKQLCAIIDDASRLIVGYGLFDNATAENAVKVLDKAVFSYGCPRQLISDHGVQFTSIARENCPQPENNTFQKRMSELGIQHIKARIKHPQTNGKMERWFQTARFLEQHFGSLHKAVSYYNERRPHMSLENGSLRTPLQAFLEKA